MFVFVSLLFTIIRVLCLFPSRFVTNNPPFTICESWYYDLFTIRGSIHVSSKHNMWVVYIRRLILILVYVYFCDFIHNSSSITSLESCFLLYDLFWFVIIFYEWNMFHSNLRLIIMLTKMTLCHYQCFYHYLFIHHSLWNDFYSFSSLFVSLHIGPYFLYHDMLYVKCVFYVLYVIRPGYIRLVIFLSMRLYLYVIYCY